MLFTNLIMFSLTAMQAFKMVTDEFGAVEKMFSYYTVSQAPIWQDKVVSLCVQSGVFLITSRCKGVNRKKWLDKFGHKMWLVNLWQVIPIGMIRVWVMFRWLVKIRGWGGTWTSNLVYNNPCVAISTSKPFIYFTLTRCCNLSHWLYWAFIQPITFILPSRHSCPQNKFEWGKHHWVYMHDQTSPDSC